MKKRIGLGTWSWGNKLFWNYQSTNDDDLRETYNEALRRGFDLIDTADSYGTGNLQGRSELLIGKFLLNTPSAKKKRIQVATKLAPYPWRIGNRGFNKPFLKSLERLNNKLDIVQLHWSTAKYNPWQELGLLNNLCDLKDEGFDFQIGLSNIGPKRLMKLIHFLAKRDQSLKSVQIQFSLLAPDLEKQYQVKKICNIENINFQNDLRDFSLPLHTNQGEPLYGRHVYPGELFSFNPSFKESALPTTILKGICTLREYVSPALNC